MKKFYLFAAIFALFCYLIYSWISSLPTTSSLADPNVEFTPEAGEKLFWGRGTCHVCHRIGKRGYALRGPNLGDSKDGQLVLNSAPKTLA